METEREIILGINKYKNIKYIARPEIKLPGSDNTLLFCNIDVKQSFLVIIIYVEVLIFRFKVLLICTCAQLIAIFLVNSMIYS